MSLQEPLTPSNCDLREFPFMPLEVERLRRSKAWLIAKRRPELGFYMVNLWCASWHELPAASLEDDDDVLAELAGCDRKRWDKVRAEVLRGWIKCSDGRLYHPVVAEKANESWNSRERYRERMARARAAKAGHNDKPPTPPSHPKDSSMIETGIGQITERIAGHKREGEREGEERREKGDSLAGQPGVSEPRARTPLDGVVPCSETGKPTVNGWLVGECFDRCLEAARANPVVFRGDWQPLIAWLRDGYEPAHILAVIERRAKRDGYYPPNSLMLFDSDVRAQVRRVA